MVGIPGKPRNALFIGLPLVQVQVQSCSCQAECLALCAGCIGC